MSDSKMINKEAAKEIRKALKAELGVTGRQVSVRCDGSGLSVTIKDARVPMPAVKEIAKRFQRAEYDAMGHTCIGGMLVVVSYDFDLIDVEAMQIEDAIQRVLDGEDECFAWGGLTIYRDNEPGGPRVRVYRGKTPLPRVAQYSTTAHGVGKDLVRCRADYGWDEVAK